MFGGSSEVERVGSRQHLAMGVSAGTDRACRAARVAQPVSLAIPPQLLVPLSAGCVAENGKRRKSPNASRPRARRARDRAASVVSLRSTVLRRSQPYTPSPCTTLALLQPCARAAKRRRRPPLPPRRSLSELPPTLPDSMATEGAPAQSAPGRPQSMSVDGTSEDEIGGADGAASTSAAGKAKHRRTRNGCLICRRRKKVRPGLY